MLILFEIREYLMVTLLDFLKKDLNHFTKCNRVGTNIIKETIVKSENAAVTLSIDEIAYQTLNDFHFDFPKEIFVNSYIMPSKSGVYERDNYTIKKNAARYLKKGDVCWDRIEIFALIVKEWNPSKGIIVIQPSTSTIFTRSIENQNIDDLRWIQFYPSYFTSYQRALDALSGKEEIPKGKRKPRPIRGMNEQEISKFLNISVEKMKCI